MKTLAALATCLLAGFLVAGCGPSAEEQAGADRMQRSMDSQRAGMKSPATPR